jgi:hypothetical protein
MDQIGLQTLPDQHGIPRAVFGQVGDGAESEGGMTITFQTAADSRTPPQWKGKYKGRKAGVLIEFPPGELPWREAQARATSLRTLCRYVGFGVTSAGRSLAWNQFLDGLRNEIGVVRDWNFRKCDHDLTVKGLILCALAFYDSLQPRIGGFVRYCNAEDIPQSAHSAFLLDRIRRQFAPKPSRSRVGK